MKVTRRALFGPLGACAIIPVAFENPNGKPLAYSYSYPQCAECGSVMGLLMDRGQTSIPESIKTWCETSGCKNEGIPIEVIGQPRYRA